MRNINRIKPFLERIEEVWKKYPDLRFGQLINNIFEHQPTLFYYLEDFEIIEIIEEFYKQMEK
jgi:hypothetical protein